jgi:hypothetical protein
MTGTNSLSHDHPQSFPRDEFGHVNRDEFGHVNDEFGHVNVPAGSVIDLEEGISSLPTPERSQCYPKEEFVVPPLGAVNLGR